MPTRKQRRRQQKSRRHEWEYVYVDDEGQEVPVDPAELRQSKEEREKSRNGRRPASGKPAERRGARTIAPPSWSRVGRRAVFIAPVVIIAMMLLNRHQPLSGRIVPALVLLAFFLPFSYFTDAAAYRMYKKRLERTTSRRKDS